MNQIEVSPKCVFVSHCILAQTVRAEGCAKTPAIIDQVVRFLMDHEFNIMQMPCPESLAVGITRGKHGKKWYEKQGIREVCKNIAEGQVEYMKLLQDAGKEVVGIIGVEFSPACSFTRDSKSVYRQEGIYGEELRLAMDKNGISAKMISVHSEWKDRLDKDLRSLLSEGLDWTNSCSKPT